MINVIFIIVVKILMDLSLGPDLRHDSDGFCFCKNRTVNRKIPSECTQSDGFFSFRWKKNTFSALSVGWSMPSETSQIPSEKKNERALSLGNAN